MTVQSIYLKGDNMTKGVELRAGIETLQSHKGVTIAKIFESADTLNLITKTGTKVKPITRILVTLEWHKPFITYDEIRLIIQILKASAPKYWTLDYVLGDKVTHISWYLPRK